MPERLALARPRRRRARRSRAQSRRAARRAPGSAENGSVPHWPVWPRATSQATASSNSASIDARVVRRRPCGCSLIRSGGGIRPCSSATSSRGSWTTRSAPSSSAVGPVASVQNCPPTAMHGRGASCRSAPRISATPSSTPAVAVESATRSGCSSVDQRDQVVGRRTRAEQQHLPAVGLEEVGHHPRPEHVLLAGRAADHREPPVARRARAAARLSPSRIEWAIAVA